MDVRTMPMRCDVRSMHGCSSFFGFGGLGLASEIEITVVVGFARNVIGTWQDVPGVRWGKRH